PGLSLGGIGQWFNRHDTWAEKATAWVDYMSRSCYMLQQGVNVADILVYYGENSNITALYGRGGPEVPQGYNFDYCNADALCNLICCEDGILTSSASGTRYRVLWLDRNVEYMSLPVLRKLDQLAKAGALIGGQKPQHPYSLNESREEFDSLVSEIWNCKNVTEGVPMADVLAKANITPDCQLPEEGMKYLHRTMPHAEIYWVNRPTKEGTTLDVSFRQTGLKPQVWHPETGVIEDVSYRMNGKQTHVTLNLVKDDAVFVVFCGTGAKEQTVPAKTRSTIANIDTPWTVQFQEHRGAPSEVTFETLTSWSEHADAGIRYFSGTANYQNMLHVAVVDSEARQVLQLGKVKNLAEVKVNGQSAGIVWKEPFEIDVTGLLHEGDNSIEIEITNLWVNRLIGDVQPGCKKPITYTDAHYYAPDAPLEEAGLMGPVYLLETTKQEVR
ncbi:MAG: glycoside hydrolase family 2, partial [Bacteroidales bacterium]|nr:glycoside hydrolase family 2 [Bacteroidales bacterium]